MPEISDLIKELKNPESKQIVRRILNLLRSEETLVLLLADLEAMDTKDEETKEILGKFRELAIVVAKSVGLRGNNAPVF